MITCNKCGYEYQSNVLQTPVEETLRSQPHEDIMENCPKCNHTGTDDAQCTAYKRDYLVGWNAAVVSITGYKLQLHFLSS